MGAMREIEMLQTPDVQSSQETQMTSPKLRPGNSARNYLLAHWVRSEIVDTHTTSVKLSHLVDSIPKLAAILRDASTDEAETIYHGQSPASRVFGRLTGRYRLLADCVLDLMLVSCFHVVRECTESELASVYIDAVLYQATGSEAEVPTEHQVRDEGTHKVRGVAKYAVRTQYSTVDYGDSRMFGKEVSAILTGSANNIAYITMVSPISIHIVAVGKWAANYAIHGTLPTEAEKSEANSLYDESMRSLSKMISSMTKKD
jgi:hypothetical protein